jgi:exosortase A-associated hydrolase 1
MARDMRRLLSFDCEGAALGATLDDAGGVAGLLMVTGGSQTRIGSHRMYERLSKGLSEHGISCFRFDRRGVGDCAGADPGYRGSGPDVAAALAAFRRECPALARIYGFGLCDGASALALFGDGLDGLVMVNPWLVEATQNAPPAAAVRRHYLARLTSREGWKKLLTGAVDFGKLARGIARLLFRREDPSLARDIATALRRRRIPVELILARGDGTAIAAEAEIKRGEFNGLIDAVQTLDSDSHTFARPGDEAALLTMVLDTIEGWEAAQAS